MNAKKYKIATTVTKVIIAIVIIYIVFGLWVSTNIAFNHGTGYGITAVALDITSAIVLLWLFFM